MKLWIVNGVQSHWRWHDPQFWRRMYFLVDQDAGYKRKSKGRAQSARHD
jgi:hypothetical protein